MTKTQENITHKRAKKLALSQQVSTTPQWTDKTACKTRNISYKEDPQRSTGLERSVKIFLLEGLNKFHGTNLTLISDVDQDK